MMKHKVIKYALFSLPFLFLLISIFRQHYETALVWFTVSAYYVYDWYVGDKR